METVHGQSLKEVRTPNPLSRADVDALLAWLEANLPEPPDWLAAAVEGYEHILSLGGPGAGLTFHNHGALYSKYSRSLSLDARSSVLPSSKRLLPQTSSRSAPSAGSFTRPSGRRARPGGTWHRRASRRRTTC